MRVSKGCFIVFHASARVKLGLRTLRPRESWGASKAPKGQRRRREGERRRRRLSIVRRTRRGARLQNSKEEEAKPLTASSPTPSGRLPLFRSLSSARWRWKLLVTGQVQRRGASAREVGRRRPARHALVLGRAAATLPQPASSFALGPQRSAWGTGWAVFYSTVWLMFWLF